MPESTAPAASGDRWENLLRASRSWRLEWNASELLERVCHEAVGLLDLDVAGIYLLHEGKPVLRGAWPRSAAGPDRDARDYRREAAEKVTRTGRALCGHHLAGEDQPSAADDSGFVLCVPLTASQGILGALYCESREKGRGLERRDQEFLEMLGLQASAALEHILLYQSAITDPLTGLFSHRYFQQQVDQEVRRAKRTGRPASLLIMDLDRFKDYNDTLGHDAGNRLLVAVADVLRSVLRASDVLARFGGDEFEVLLPETEAKRARQVAEKIRWRIGRMPSEGSARVTATLGVATWPDNATDAQALFLRADAALYRAKQAGRNRTARSDHSEAAPAVDPASERGRRAPRTEAEIPLDRPDRAVAAAAADAAAIETPGREIIDGHEVIKRLATGSVGEVLLVRQPELGREVALKRPLTASLTAEQAEIFRREARTTASLTHPGVIPVFTMGRDADGRQYYTMKRLEGPSLGEILEGRARGDAALLRQYSQKSLLEVLHRVAETLAYAHAQEAAHLDLNPWNIVVGKYGEVTVIDWGEGARASAGRQRRGRRRRKGSRSKLPALVPGSPRYMAPEQLPGSAELPGAPADVHSLGAILYEILCGRPPYLGKTARETVEALRTGRLVPPEEVAPEAGIDPALSALCSAALAGEPSARPGAGDFAERLGRHIRSEKDWEVIRFGPGGKALDPAEWSAIVGEWQARGDEWVSAGKGDCVLVWSLPAPGDFRFVAEGLTEGPSELALIGHGPRPGTAPFSDITGEHFYRAYEGYCFEFGAENNTCTKLARHGHDVQALAAPLLERGRRYRLEIEYQDGWLRCFLDERLIFSYRELFPLAGSSVGFYAHGPGARIKPLEVHRQNWALQPAMRMADDLFRLGFPKAAVERYVQVADRNPHRLEGDEARLKIGICLAAQEQTEPARRMFRSVNAGPLQPFALAEEAMLEFRGREGSQPTRGLELFEELMAKFPDSHAKVRIIEAASRTMHFANQIVFSENCGADLEARLRLHLLGARTCIPPTQSQAHCWRRACFLMMRLARHRQALESSLEMARELAKLQRPDSSFSAIIGAASLAAGEDGALREIPLGPSTVNLGIADWGVSVIGCIAVRTGMVEAAREGGAGAARLAEVIPTLPPADRVAVLLAAGDVEAAKAELRHAASLEHGPAAQYVWAYEAFHYGMPATESGIREVHELGLEAVRSLEERTRAERRPGFARLDPTLRARWALEQDGDFAAAAAVLEGLEPHPRDVPFSDAFLLQCLLSSLELLKSPGREELAAGLDHHLTGTPLDLARMLLGQKPPVPGAEWPHPLWRPEWRLWLAIWLEAKGERAAAAEIARPARDDRYGLTNSQPALKKLLARL